MQPNNTLTRGEYKGKIYFKDIMLEKNHVGPETNRKVGSESEEIIPDPQHCYSLSISNWQ
jgi:hypothetical protein